MGLLDDAIREHLELKRRRGADPTEIERAEKEALGPVRRGPGGRAPTDADLEDEPDWGPEEHAGDLPAAAPTAVTPPPVAAHEPVVPLEPREPVAPPPPIAAPKPVPAPDPPRVPPIGAPISPRRPALSEETEEWDVEQAFADERREQKPTADAKHHEEDVLEETPDFLQDTPDHDRLWFEQRPPRDFDFDG
jgi:hypothetical protein